MLIDERRSGNLPDAPIVLIIWSKKNIQNPSITPPKSLKAKFDWFLFGEIENTEAIKTIAQRVNGINKSV